MFLFSLFSPYLVVSYLSSFFFVWSLLCQVQCKLDCRLTHVFVMGLFLVRKNKKYIKVQQKIYYIKLHRARQER